MYWKYSEEQSTHSLETYIVTGREKVTVLSIIKKKKKGAGYGGGNDGIRIGFILDKVI